MVEYNKKQIQPLVDKYQINVTTNKLFEHIITSFDNQPAYQAWAIKVVFDRKMSIDELNNVITWVNANKNGIKLLSKGNIVAYNTKADIALLFMEMKGYDMVHLIKEMVSKFNTEQRQMLTEHIFKGKDIELKEVAADSTIKGFFDLFSKIQRAPAARKAKLFRCASNVHGGNIKELIGRIEGTLKESYAWEKEDCRAYILNNFKDCSIIFDKGTYLIAQIGSFHSSKSICGNSRTSWCITQNNSHWESYVGNKSDRRRQYFYFDFSKPEKDEIAHVGFTVEDGTGIVEAQSCGNSCMRGDGISYGNGRVSINDILTNCGCGLGRFLNMKKPLPFKWSIEEFNRYIPTTNKMEIVCSKGNICVVKFASMSAAQEFFSYSFIPTSAFGSIGEGTQCFGFFDFNKEANEDNSAIAIIVNNDKWGTKSITRSYNIYGAKLDAEQNLFGTPITKDEIIPEIKIKNEVLLHKYIEENAEDKAVQLVENNKDIDVNYVFSSDIPVYKAILKRMYKLFEVIITSPQYEVNAPNGLGGTMFDMLMYIYVADEIQKDKNDREAIHKMIDIISENPRLNVNLKNTNGDTAICVAAEFKELGWVFNKLVARKDVDVNVVNDFSDTALSIALAAHNDNAVKMLCMRPDLKVDSKTTEVAKKEGYDLKKLINPNAKMLVDAPTKVKSEEEAFIEALANA